MSRHHRGLGASSHPQHRRGEYGLKLPPGMWGDKQCNQVGTSEAVLSKWKEHWTKGYHRVTLWDLGCTLMGFLSQDDR